MNDLAELLPIEKTVPLASGTVTVRGLSIRKVTALITKHPELLSLLNGKTDFFALITTAPERMLDIVSLAISDEQNSSDVLKSFDDAPAGQQIDVLSAIMELTLSGQKAKPFLEGVMRGYARTFTNPAPENSTATSPVSSPS